MEREILIQSPLSAGPIKIQMSQTQPQWKFLAGKLVWKQSLSFSLFPLICLSLSVSFLVSLSVYSSGFVVGNGPSADWYLPFITAADAKVLEHSGKLQLLLEILHWAEELQDKVWGSHSWIEVALLITFCWLLHSYNPQFKILLNEWKNLPLQEWIAF